MNNAYINKELCFEKSKEKNSFIKLLFLHIHKIKKIIIYIKFYILFLIINCKFNLMNFFFEEYFLNGNSLFLTWEILRSIGSVLLIY